MLGARVLRSARHGLVGRPDHLLRVGRTIIPVEQKHRARRVQHSHVLQAAAQCLLVEEEYGVRPAYALVVLADGVQQQVQYTRGLERQLIETMAEMRAYLVSGVAPGPRWIGHKCRPCGFCQACWE